MEGDDEFGDLYGDVLRPFSSSLSSTSHPQESSPAPLSRFRIDLNQNDRNRERDGDDEILYGVSDQNAATPADRNTFTESNVRNSAAPGVGGLASAPSSFPQAKMFPEKHPGPGNLDEDEVNFDIEEGNVDTIGEDSVNPMMTIIPGLMEESSRKTEGGVAVSRGGWGEEEEDSDSDDDLHIVLNDSSPSVKERGSVIGDGEEDDDEDGDPLVIIADGDPVHGMEEQEWGGGGEDASGGLAGTEGESKVGNDGAAGKAASAAVGPKIGYNNHGYHHPFHSQFKYVRPGAPMTTGPGGVPVQVRPPINMGPMVGRGRGDWRPAAIRGASTVQKSFHPGFSIPGRGNMQGRGGGLEFTLPSHKTIFDVDIDGFEEKPWKYPGVDISDFFNFGLNEESWKDYCKQLEQHRLETTMQSKIRVYESGRAEQDYDPDLPPELAAATVGIHDVAAELGKSNAGQADLMKGSARPRPPILTGRAIQVEGGSGERLPSMETRAPRIRDPDAVIEIIPQDSLNDNASEGNGTEKGANNGLSEDNFRDGHAAEDDMTENEYFDNFTHDHTNKKSERKLPYVTSVCDNASDEGGNSSLDPETSEQYHRGSRVLSPCPDGNFGSPQEKRISGKSPHLTAYRGSQDKKFIENVEEESVESVGRKSSASTFSIKDAGEFSNNNKDNVVTDEPLPAEGSSGMERDEMTEKEVSMSDAFKNEKVHCSRKKQPRNSKQPALQEHDDREDSKAARSSETSKARSGSSKEYQKWQDGVEEEVVQDERHMHLKKIIDENEHNFRRKDRDVGQDMERPRMLTRMREESYLYDDNIPHNIPIKNEGYDGRKNHEIAGGVSQRRNDDPHRRKSRIEDRKREREEELGSKHWNKHQENERSDGDDPLQSRKLLENGNNRMHPDKDSSSRHREREDGWKSRYDTVEDHHHKRRKDEEYLRRDEVQKEEILYGRREIASRQRREREDVMEHRRRDDRQRIRENLDDYHSIRHKDDGWLQRERSERREKEDPYRLKQSHEENLTKLEREKGRAFVRSARGMDDKAWTGRLRLKDEYRGSEKEYQLKDAGRNSERQKRRDQMDGDVFPHHRGHDDEYTRGNQFGNEQRRSRQERPSFHNDRAVDISDNQKVIEKKHRENSRKNKESEGGDRSTSSSTRRNQEDQSSHADEMRLKRTGEHGEDEIPVLPNPSKRHKENASPDDEQQDSKRGRSKLERWMSHEERDYSISSKSSTSFKFKEIDGKNNGGSSEDARLPDEARRGFGAVEKQPHVAAEKDTCGIERTKDSDTKPLEVRHLDTVEKLKKRSERFKLPMPVEKDSLSIKKMEGETLPSGKTEIPVDSEIKPERPPRKRRWVSD